MTLYFLVQPLLLGRSQKISVQMWQILFTCSKAGFCLSVLGKWDELSFWHQEVNQAGVAKLKQSFIKQMTAYPTLKKAERYFVNHSCVWRFRIRINQKTQHLAFFSPDIYFWDMRIHFLVMSRGNIVHITVLCRTSNRSSTNIALWDSYFLLHITAFLLKV